jgi:hypothetical protein
MQSAAYAIPLPPVPKAVLNALAWHHNAQTGRCDPSVATLCADTGFKELAIRRALKLLRTNGLIQSVLRHGTTPQYQLTLPPTDTLPTTDRVPPILQIPTLHTTDRGDSLLKIPKQEENQKRTEKEPLHTIALSPPAHAALAEIAFEPRLNEPANNEPDTDMELESQSEKSSKKSKPAKEQDPRHHEITSQIKGVWNGRKSDAFMFPPRFPKALEKFLQNCDASAEDFLRIYDEVLGASTLQFASLSKQACDPTFLCLHWNRVISELDNLAEAKRREEQQKRGGFKKSI